MSCVWKPLYPNLCLILKFLNRFAINQKFRAPLGNQFQLKYPRKSVLKILFGSRFGIGKYWYRANQIFDQISLCSTQMVPLLTLSRIRCLIERQSEIYVSEFRSNKLGQRSSHFWKSQMLCYSLPLLHFSLLERTT